MKLLFLEPQSNAEQIRIFYFRRIDVESQNRMKLVDGHNIQSLPNDDSYSMKLLT